MMDLPWIWTVIGSLCMIYSGYVVTGEEDDSCPHSCVCRKDTVKCYQLVSFPWSFPENTTELLFDEITVYAIPPNAFKGLHQLTKVKFSRCNLGAISACAFRNVSTLQNITFVKTVMGSIDTGAFQEIGKEMNIEFIDCKITKFESFAFQQSEEISSIVFKDTHTYLFEPNCFFDISNIGKLSFDNVKMGYVDKKAFNTKGKLKEFDLTSSSFGVLTCGAIDDLLLATTVNVNNNTFNCTCEVFWLKSKLDHPLYTQLLETGSCNIPKNIKGDPVVDILKSSTGTCKDKREQERVDCSIPIGEVIPQYKCPIRVKSRKVKIRRRRRGRSTGASLNNGYNLTILTLVLIFLLM